MTDDVEEIEVRCIEAFREKAVDAYTTRRSITYRQLEIGVPFATHGTQKVRCPHCGGNFVLTHYPELGPFTAAKKGKVPLAIGSIGALTLYVLVTYLPKGTEGIGFARLAAFVVAFGGLAIGIRGFLNDTKPAVRLVDDALVSRTGEGAPLGPTVAFQKKHQICPKAGVYTGGFESDLKRRLAYY
jgi:hypothetical protein